MEEKKDFSKYIIWGVVAVVVVAALVILSKPTSNLYVTSISGKAQITRDGQTLYLVPGEPLYSGDKIVVTKGTAKFDFNSEVTSLDLQEGSTLHIAFNAGAMVNAKVFKVTSGQVNFKVQNQTADQSMQVLTENTKIDVIGTDFSVKEDESSSTIAVTKGLVSILNNASGDNFNLPEKYEVTVSGKKYPEIKSIGKTSLPKVIDYTVIDPEQNLPMDKYRKLAGGAQISMADLPASGYNFRANIANASIIKNVRFTLTNSAGKIIHSSTEESLPYTMAGIGKGQATYDYDFNAYEAKPGTYILTVDVFTPKSAAPAYSSKFKYTLK